MKAAYALGMLGLATAAVILGAPALPLPAAAAMLYALYLARGAGRPSAADIATSARLASALGAALLGALAPRALSGWAIPLVFAAGEITDWLDGKLARRHGGSPFGAALDEETDAAFILTVSLVLVVARGIPDRVVAAGLLRYASVPVFALMRTPGRFPRVFSWSAKVFCASAAVMLLTATAPALGTATATALGDAALALLGISFGWEALIRVGRLPGVARARGLARSLLVYYGVPGKFRRTARLYGTLVGHGGLAFDIGSHVGNRVAVLRRLGARVVAVEPNPRLARLLRRLYGRDPQVTIIEAAVSSAAGHATLRLSRSHPTVSSIDHGWIQTVAANPLFRGVTWDEDRDVDSITLDSLVGRFGRPQFCKIDIEGGDADALQGLSVALEAVSFEYLPAAIGVALDCVARLAALGTYRFNASRVETMVLALADWTDAAGITAWLREKNPTDRSGDIYARLET